MQDRTKIQDVASLCQFLREEEGPCCLSVKGTMLSMGASSANAVGAWTGIPAWPRREEVSQEAVESGLYSLVPPDGPVAVCSMSGAGHSLSHLHVCLTEDEEKQTIVLDESCSDVRIQESILEGTLLHSTCGLVRN